ncbi:MAG: macro domain-containing protein [Lentisphaeraceae bacterium]|nr:macro domain-containing protein [Lentisphaeraceae bacterium]
MKLIELKEDILNVKSDALIYSTNTRLSLSGGVGAALMKKFGHELQTELINESDGFGFELASLGDVFEARTNNMPWVKVFHTICLDGNYIADEQIVRSVLVKALNKCEETKEVLTVSISALGTGYGSLSYPSFKKILTEIIREIRYQTIDEIYLCNLGEQKL